MGNSIASKSNKQQDDVIMEWTSGVDVALVIVTGLQVLRTCLKSIHIHPSPEFAVHLLYASHFDSLIVGKLVLMEIQAHRCYVNRARSWIAPLVEFTVCSLLSISPLYNLFPCFLVS